ncbi:MlaD family protein [Lacinutrix sp. MedPE-SW]|uniref:MlaD family protein n=1 Tax=Lacinutrix sp. MedPE-SW TaxID=1860087 RepID=UPI00091073B2|nr:MlaD family protein [Lacinutrix sp. MedPE-SW]OIQ23776.1 MAG: mammalian cell entry protein [Lacinutrix sp. MedPE-SW]
MSREVKTAILVIAGIALFIFGFNYLKGENLLEADNSFYTTFEYNGLTSSSPVTIKGNNVGRISEIKYDFETGKTRVAFQVDEKLKFSKDSKIRLYELGLMGGNGIAIIPGDSKELAKSGDYIESEVEVGLISSLTSNFSGLSNELDGTLKAADSLLLSLNDLVQDDSEKGLRNALSELNNTLRSFQTLSKSFNGVIASNEKNLNEVLTNFNTVSQDLAILSNNLKDVNIDQTVKNLDNTLASVDGLIADLNKGEGSMGKLLKDDKLYNNLEVASYQLKELLQDFKLNPKRYVNISVFGKKSKPYVEPEDERE